MMPADKGSGLDPGTAATPLRSGAITRRGRRVSNLRRQERPLWCPRNTLSKAVGIGRGLSPTWAQRRA